MTSAERKLAATLLRMAADQFSNHGCNDFDLGTVIPDQAERDALVRKYHEWNGDLEEMEENGWLEQSGERDYRLMDWTAMDFLAHLIEADKPAPPEHPDGGCPACGRGSGPFCYAHSWHND